jgi:hypothetical protein
MGSKVTGVFNILLGSFGIYMVGFRPGVEFALFPKPIGFAICGAMIIYGLYLLFRRPAGS